MKLTTQGGPVPPEAAPRFIAQLEENSALAAGAAGGWRDLNLTLADAAVRLRFAGPALESTVAPAFAHLTASNGGDPALTVHLWDSDSTGAPPPQPPWDPGTRPAYGEIASASNDDICTWLHWGTNAVSSVDVRTGRAFFWMRSTMLWPISEEATPLRAVLTVWLRRRGIELVHASAVGTPSGCALIVGKSGKGKSSTALACLAAGMGILADDHCAIAPGPQPTVFSLFSAAKAYAETLARLPSLAGMEGSLRGPPDEKALLFVHANRPEQLLAQAPLRAVLVPRVTGERDSAVHPATAAAALAALAPSTIMQLHARNQTTLTRLGEVVRSVPCYRLDAGLEPARVAAAIETVLR